MSLCYPCFSMMCKDNYYENCNLNVFNFWQILCLYYDIYNYHSVSAVLINLPLIIFTLPFLPPALFLYLLYLLVLPIGDVFELFFPVLAPFLIPIVTFFLIGVSKVRLSKVFKWR
ncbi:hypothetical protein [Acidianus bottle-shaped virus 3 strain ABV3]|uniref:Uncharacterized protein n=1 Tax=Acidianus bottle-shaped virus 3 strain ABV3 TaxID=1732174 RepID=A0A0N9NWD5_9VIRU|nr:hypothetical protein AVU00_gp60 [Acidianus bottle-shaped virus 3 strain ABV3]ALG96862.1 hypothetical protein [Acidianus bottle-shaped virus 3 strain ABV3]